MGVEISKSFFSEKEFSVFKNKINTESSLLKDWFETKHFSKGMGIGGFELEAWLIGEDARAAPENMEVLEGLDEDKVQPEFSKFNLEFNTNPESLAGEGLFKLRERLSKDWKEAAEKAKARRLRLIMIGILPTVNKQQLTINQMTPTNRYYALNSQLMKMRKEAPIEIDIKGVDHLKIKHKNMMLESAATSFQIHLQVNQKKGVDFYNASKIASAPLVAIAANSPFLFEHELWEESRIPLFEQSISLAEKDYAERVTFGMRYLDDSLMEYFDANRQRYVPLLPLLYKDKPEKLRHLCLHNGTIWRWTRVIIGDTKAKNPHLRIEQRVASAGPTIEDCLANSAFFYGLVTYLAYDKKKPEENLDFYQARNNFYEAARLGLEASVTWENNKTQTRI